jgi:hypothetical protein
VERLVIGLGAATALAAAARSTWSPCGLSMLSSITPFGERSRGHRYAVTAGWFVLGSVAGGATLGALAAALAAVAAATGLRSHPVMAAVLAATAALACAGVDAGVFGDLLPLRRRQVDDRWLARYRAWAYGAGFGWQIGVGVATYVMTAAVALLVVLGALTADPVAAAGQCALLGLARGLAVLLTSRAPPPAPLRNLHRWLDRAEGPVRRLAIAVQVAGAAVAVGDRWPVAGLFLGVAGAGGLVKRAIRAGARARLDAGQLRPASQSSSAWHRA